MNVEENSTRGPVGYMASLRLARGECTALRICSARGADVLKIAHFAFALYFDVTPD
jgi:hypothetical protein